MANQRLILESACDKSRYKLEIDPDAIILSVTYRHINGRYGEFIPQKVTEATIDYYRAWKTDGAPETESESYWFLRSLYEHHQGNKAFWFYFKPTQTLVVCPPPPDSGSLISVVIDEAPEETEVVDIPTPDVPEIPNAVEIKMNPHSEYVTTPMQMPMSVYQFTALTSAN